MNRCRQPPTAEGYRGDWATPQGLVDAVAAMCAIPFRLDVCATKETAKAPAYFGPDHDDPMMRDALAIEWPCTGIWCNPPFERKVAKQFAARCAAVASNHGFCALLLPTSNSDQLWHAQMMMEPCVIGLIDVVGRVAFEIDGVGVRGNSAGTQIVLMAKGSIRRGMAYGVIWRDGEKWEWQWKQ